MLTNEILDKCFLVLGSALDADAAVAQITEIFRENKIETSDPFGYLLQNASTFFEQHGANEEQERLAKLIEALNSKIIEIDDKIKKLRKGDAKQIEDSNLQRQDLVKEKTRLNSQDDEEEHGKKQKFDIYKKNAQKTRNEAVANFLGLKYSEKYFNQERSQPLLALMLSNSMFWTPQVTLAAIEASENVKGKIKTKERRVEGGKFVEVESELGYVEYLLSQRSFGKDTPYVKDVALSLLRKGCDFDATSNINWSNLLHSRAVESGLLAALCNYFIKEENNFELFFKLIERVDEKAYSLTSLNVSRLSAAASRGGVAANVSHIGEFEVVAKEVVDECVLHNELWDEKSKMSLPRFLLSRNNAAQNKKFEFSKRFELSKRLWTHIQAREKLNHIFPDIFLSDLQFLHEIIATNNASLLSIAIESIDQLEIDSQDKIYRAKDKEGDDVFADACRLGHDYAIEALFPIVARDVRTREGEIKKGWDIVIKKGFAKSAALLIEKAKELKIDIDHGANLAEILEKGGQDAVLNILGELKVADPAHHVLSGELLVHYPELLHEIIRINNADLVERVVKSMEELSKRSKTSERDKSVVFEFKDENGDTPFLAACRLGFDDAIETLFDTDIERVEEGLQICAARGFAKSIKKIMAKVRAAKMSINLGAPLLSAISENKETAAMELVANGADVNAPLYSVRVEERQIVPLIITPLEAAAMAGNKILVSEFMKIEFLKKDPKYFEKKPQEIDKIEKRAVELISSFKAIERDKKLYWELIRDNDSEEKNTFSESRDLKNVAYDLAIEMSGLLHKDSDRAKQIKTGIAAAILYAKIAKSVVADDGRIVSPITPHEIEAIKSGNESEITKISNRIAAESIEIQSQRRSALSGSSYRASASRLQGHMGRGVENS